MNYKKYFWILPALYVSLEFGGKFFEVLSDKVEIVDTISVIKPLSAIADYLAYGVGAFDLLFAVTLLTCSYAALSKKYYPYLFAWAAIWPFVPACFRYFGGVGDFEIVSVLSISVSAIVAYLLYQKYSIS